MAIAPDSDSPHPHLPLKAGYTTHSTGISAHRAEFKGFRPSEDRFGDYFTFSTAMQVHARFVRDRFRLCNVP